MFNEILALGIVQVFIYLFIYLPLEFLMTYSVRTLDCFGQEVLKVKTTLYCQSDKKKWLVSL